MKKFLHSRKKGFTLVELLVGMTIFTVGITSIFLLLESTFKSESISRNEIIVANLLREQIELIRNLKENNYKNFAKWDLAKITDENQNTTFYNFEDFLKNSDKKILLVENNFGEEEFKFDENWIKESPIKITEKILSDEKNDEKIFEETRLCFNLENFYIHCNNSTNEKKTSFASYIQISKMKKNETENFDIDAYLIEAFVINKNGSNYRKYNAKTIITNWMK